ncbi:unnamed protein product [Polarella glacialis]|uniref:Uncharacterized protein n=1 Tax=Polarella glacialis TaxID=89957 RepID=A0A813K2G7_POLGL|nr:unnamed protein product [Polarella glacialis]
MLAGPSSRIQQLENLVGAARDCSNFDSLPKLGFKIGNKILNLDPDDYMDTSDNDCTLSSMALDVPPPKGIICDPYPTATGLILLCRKHHGKLPADLIAEVGMPANDAAAPAEVAARPGAVFLRPGAVFLRLSSGMLNGDVEEADSPDPPSEEDVALGNEEREDQGTRKRSSAALHPKERPAVCQIRGRQTRQFRLSTLRSTTV